MPEVRTTAMEFTTVQVQLVASTLARKEEGTSEVGVASAARAREALTTVDFTVGEGFMAEVECAVAASEAAVSTAADSTVESASMAAVASMGGDVD